MQELILTEEEKNIILIRRKTKKEDNKVVKTGIANCDIYCCNQEFYKVFNPYDVYSMEECVAASQKILTSEGFKLWVPKGTRFYYWAVGAYGNYTDPLSHKIIYGWSLCKKVKGMNKNELSPSEAEKYLSQVEEFPEPLTRAEFDKQYRLR